MNGIAAVGLYAVLLAAAVRAGLGIIAERRSDGDRRIPVATVTALVVVSVPTLLQLIALPSLLDAWNVIGQPSVTDRCGAC